MNIPKIARNPRLCRALIGMSHQEFSDLVPVFETSLIEFRMQKPHRKRKVGAGQKGVLNTIESKLFFILFYLKTYPTFDVLGFLTDKERSHACEAVRLYAHVLKIALGRELALPKRKIASVDEFFALFPDAKDVFLDGTERSIQRPKNSRRQKKTYSGKKKATTRKNIVMTDERKRILFLSPTKSGRRHDKRLADKVSLISRIPPSVGIFADSGFQGIQHAHANVWLPKKGTKKHPLTDEERQANTLGSSIRMKVEHAIAGVKRFRALSDVLRNKIGELDDLFMELGAGLWNRHLRYTS